MSMEMADAGSPEGLEALKANLDAGELTFIKRHGKIAGVVIPMDAATLLRGYLDRNPEVVAQINDAIDHPERALPVTDEMFEGQEPEHFSGWMPGPGDGSD